MQNGIVLRMDYPRLIKAIMRASGSKQGDLAKRLHVSQPTVSRWLKGGQPEAKHHERIIAEAKRLRVLAAANDDDDQEIDISPFPSGFGVVSTLKPYASRLPGGMPDIDVSGGMGPGGLALPAVDNDGGVTFTADAVRGEIVLPPYIIAEFTHAKPQRVHWIKVRGDSMEGTLAPGDRVGVDTTDTAIGQGGVFVIRDNDGEILVKRLRKVRSSDSAGIEIISDNAKQGNDVVGAEDIAILGRVVARLSRVG